FPDVLAANWITIALQHRMGLRVPPLPASCRAAAGARFSSFPVSQALRLSSPQVFRSPQKPRCDDHLPMRPRVTPIPSSSGSPTVNLRVAPDLRSVCGAFRPTSKFPWLLCLPALPVDRYSGRPESRPALPQMRLRVSPAPASTAGSMVNPANPNFAPSSGAGG